MGSRLVTGFNDCFGMRLKLCPYMTPSSSSEEFVWSRAWLLHAEIAVTGHPQIANIQTDQILPEYVSTMFGARDSFFAQRMKGLILVSFSNANGPVLHRDPGFVPVVGILYDWFARVQLRAYLAVLTVWPRDETIWIKRASSEDSHPNRHYVSEGNHLRFVNHWNRDRVMKSFIGGILSESAFRTWRTRRKTLLASSELCWFPILICYLTHFNHADLAGSSWGINKLDLPYNTIQIKGQ
jgi:hypothetical protein